MLPQCLTKLLPLITRFLLAPIRAEILSPCATLTASVKDKLHSTRHAFIHIPPIPKLKHRSECTPVKLPLPERQIAILFVELLPALTLPASLPQFQMSVACLAALVGARQPHPPPLRLLQRLPADIAQIVSRPYSR